MELLLGILCGIALSLFFSFGPAFFSQLQASIHYGYRRAVPFAFGVSAGDVLIVFMMLTVLKNVDMTNVLRNVWVASISAVAMAAMGIHTFRKTARVPQSNGESIPAAAPRRRTVFFHGFLLNFVNPLIWIYWVSVIALISGEMGISTGEMYLFFVGVLGTTLCLDMLKCKAASLLHKIITDHVLNVFNKVTGGILVVFAAYLLISMWVYQTNPERDFGAPNQTEMIKNIHKSLPTASFGTSQGK